MGLKKNVTYSIILTLSTYLVPLLVYPYITRVLGPDGMGYIDTVDSVIDYCVLFSMMGLTTIGVREIARNRLDPLRLERTFSGLFTLNLVSTAFVILVLTVLVLTVPVMHERSRMFFIGMTKIVSNLFWVEWFFKGLENFRYITIRSVVLRLLFIAMVFIFVRESDDTVTYYILWVGLTFCNALCNWTYRRRFSKLSLRRALVSPYVKPVLLLGLFAVFSAVYTKLNVFYLGAVCGDTQVGFYTVATRLYSVLIALFTSITSVMIPRMSILVSEGDHAQVRTLTDKTFQALFLFALPTMAFFSVFAPEFVMIFTGMDFEFYGAVTPMRVVMCQLLVIGTEQIFILQLLVPSGHDRQAVLCAFTGTIVCVLMNLLLLPGLGSTGSAFAWVAAEVTVLSVSSIFVKRYLGISFPFRMFFRYLLLSLPYLGLGLVTNAVISAPIPSLITGAMLFGLWFTFLEERVLGLRLIGNAFSMIRKRK